MLAALLAIGCAVADDVPVVVLRTPAAAAKMAAPSFEELWNDAGDHMPWVVETRRELHRMPELLFDEHMICPQLLQVKDRAVDPLEILRKQVPGRPLGPFHAKDNGQVLR